MNAIRDAAGNGSPFADIGMCFVLGVSYVAIGVLVTESVLRSARKRASLSLT
jgi:hypothetical protein